ncbi:hypothetical protein H5410_058431 [Solanum commersonii]|uniref:Uncharacterized protein n=1 Tax=Solanum commersonii TaxID=4109 RepID=A0A9J5WR25_SOLCO|nr:hypothetical protein H5410_058431 [Solanum commersonii]
MVPAELDSLEEGNRYVTRIVEKGGNLCLVNISYGPIFSLLIKNELNVTVPNMAYNINMTECESVIFIDVPTGMLLSVFPLSSSVIVIPYVPSLVSIFHRLHHF